MLRSEFLQNVRRSAGFTLVELLVVIGIIALLISVLLPAMNRARQAANTIKCESNLRQLGTAIVLYTQSYGGMLPYQGDSDVTWAPTGKFYPNLRIEKILAIGLGLKPSAGGTYPQVNVMQCPDAQPYGDRHYQSHPRLIPNFSTMQSQSFAIASTVKGTVKISKPKRPTELMLFYEATQMNFSGAWPAVGDVDDMTYHLDNGVISWNTNALLNVSNPGLDSPLTCTFDSNRDSTGWGDLNRGQLRFRHNGDKYMNAVFLDGHVESLRGSFDAKNRIMNSGDVKRRNFYVDPW